MNPSRREMLRWTLGALPIVALTGDELLADLPDRLPKIWPEGALPQTDLEACYRFFSDFCHKAATPRQDQTLAVAEEIYQLLHAWRPSAPEDEEFRRVSRRVTAHRRSLDHDVPVLKARADGSPENAWPVVDVAIGLPRVVVVEVIRKDASDRMEIVELLATGPTNEVVATLSGGEVIRVPVLATQPATLRGRVFEDGRDEPWPARMTVEGADGLFRHGVAYAPIATVSEKPVVFRPAWRKLPFFYCDGTFEVIVPPGKTRVTLERGYEHELVTTTIDLEPGERRDITMTSARVVDMRDRGWISGDTHVHWSVNTWDENEDLDLLRVVQRAEDVRVVNNLTLAQWRPDASFIKPDHAPPGPLTALCDRDYHVQMGEEFRNDNHYGHINLLGLSSLVTPISTGPGSGGDPSAIDYPINKTIIEAARKQGAISCEAHNLGPFGTSSVPVNVVHGLSDCLDQLEPDHYTRFLNCGFKIGLGNGSDHPARVLGCCRVYVRIEGEFSFARWIDGLRRGRSFTTSGPLLTLTIDGVDIGDTLAARVGDTVRVRASAVSRRDLGTFEIVSNGEVIRRITTNARRAEFDFEVKIDGPRWFTSRVGRTGNYDALSGPDIAHSSAVYVDVDGKSVFRKDAAEWWIHNIRQHRERVRLLGNFANDAQRLEALAYIDSGITRFQNLITEASHT